MFVYGSLKPGELRFKAFKTFCEYRNIEVKPIKATTKGILYALPAGFPGLVIRDSADVHGYFINTIGDPAVAEYLNAIEGYSIFESQQNFYTPQLINITLENGNELEAWNTQRCYK